MYDRNEFNIPALEMAIAMSHLSFFSCLACFAFVPEGSARLAS